MAPHVVTQKGVKKLKWFSRYLVSCLVLSHHRDLCRWVRINNNSSFFGVYKSSTSKKEFNKIICPLNNPNVYPITLKFSVYCCCGGTIQLNQPTTKSHQCPINCFDKVDAFLNWTQNSIMIVYNRTDYLSQQICNNGIVQSKPWVDQRNKYQIKGN